MKRDAKHQESSACRADTAQAWRWGTPWVVVAVCATLLLGCFESESEKCRWGDVCAQGFVCHEPTESCAPPLQIAACEGVGEGDACTYAGAPDGTYCLSGLCHLIVCGDGVVDVGEECDGGNLDGQSCETLGFVDGGTLGCDGTCLFDTSGCGAVCGNGTVEPGEECDDGGLVAGDGCSGDCLHEVVALVSGDYHNCALKADGAVWCWGGNSYGQLGDGGTTDQFTPVSVVGLPSAVSITAGAQHTCAIAEDGSGWCWGVNTYRSLGDGAAHQICRTNNCSPTPVQISVMSGQPTLTTIAAGYRHTCAVTTDGLVECWGQNESGQLGDGSTIDSEQAVQVTGLDNVIALSAASSQTCAVRQDGTAWCWGDNGAGQVGDGSTTSPRSTPVQVTGLTGAARIASGSWYTCAATSDGAGWCWGSPSSGQLGDGTGAESLVPVQVSGLTGITYLAAASHHNCAIDSGGVAWCWGSNIHGGLGDGTTENQNAPVELTALQNVQAVGGGMYHTCATTVHDGVWCWGNGSVGQLGDGLSHDVCMSFDCSLVPVPVAAF